MTDFVVVHVEHRVYYGGVPSSNLVMVRKKRPAWQDGKLNMPGGHIEKGETPDQAAARELFEETGLLAKHMPEMGTIYAGNNVIVVFRAIGVSGEPTTKTDEPVELVPFHAIGECGVLVDRNIVLMHGLITNGVRDWSLYHDDNAQEYEIHLPYLQN